MASPASLNPVESPPPPPPLAAPQPSAVAPAAEPAVGSSASLYVGDLDETVAEEQLFAIFCQVALVASLRVCRDISGKSLGYAYVNFHTREDANRAMEALNFTIVNGKSIRVMFSNRDPTLRKSGHANVFIKNLEPNIDNKSLNDMFSSFGTILSCKVATDLNGQSKGYGFVQFKNEESAKNAINSLDGMLANGRKIFVGLFVRRQVRERTGGANKFTNVYIKNLPKEFTDKDLRHEFAQFGEIASAIVTRDSDGKSRCFGFVNFETPESAAEAVKSLNGKSIKDMVLYVGRAQKKAERQAELKKQFEHEINGKLEKLQGLNLYLKNLDDNINDEQLRKLFEDFGEIGSCKVMVDSQGRSKGVGFVSFTTVEAAYKAINGMNGKMIGRKPLYVSLAQRKQERRAMLMAHFARVNVLGAMATAIPSNVAPHQFYFGQGAPGLIPPQGAGFGYHQQYQRHFIPGMGPGAPNVMMPYNMQRPRHHGQRAGGRHGGMAREMPQQQQMVHRNANQSVRNMPARNLVNPAMLPQGQGFSGPMVLQGSAQTDTARAPSIPSNNLPTALASADPEQQQLILGNRLYPLVERHEPEHAGKVTGMLLELGKTEVLNLIESEEDLRDKVSAAMGALR